MLYIPKIYIFYIFLAHLKHFLDNLICHLCIMFKFILKILINFKKEHDLDGKFWIQKALLCKNIKNNSL